MTTWSTCALSAAAWAAVYGAAAPGLAIDIEGVLPAAMDQPRINAFVRFPGDALPLYADFFGFGEYFNITAFYDTGASGVLLSSQTASLLGRNGNFSGVPLQYANGSPVVFSDIGVAGSDNFNVSVPLEIGLAPYSQYHNEYVDNFSMIDELYTTRFSNIRTQIGPIGVTIENPLLEGLDVFGMPTMAGKKVVMDSRGINTFIRRVIEEDPDSADSFDTLRTYVYEPNTPFKPATVETDPGVPQTNLHVKLSYASFDRFTKLDPSEGPGPTLRANPFFGPNPVAKLDDPNFDDGTPAIKLSYNGLSTEATFLFDTGAAASIISRDVAERLGIRYVAGTYGTDNPQLERIDGGYIGDTFTIAIGGIGGQTTLVGLYLDEMLLRTIEGNAANDLDPAHLRFIGAPVLVGDITVYDEATDQQLTLDGIFGMNFLTASASITLGGDIGVNIDAIAMGAFDWIVFDEPGGKLGFSFSQVPEPTMLAPAMLMLTFGLRRYNRRPRCR